MKWQLIIFLVLLTAGLASCAKKPGRYANEPYIEYKGRWPDSIRSGSGEDTVFISFRFTDGDADLGNDASSGNYDIFATDSRDATLYSYLFPNIPDQIRNPEKGMEGTCTFYILAAFLTLRPDHPDADTVSFSIYIKDRAGNQSNTIQTDPVYIVP